MSKENTNIKSSNKNNKENKKSKKRLLFIVFISGVLLILATYAWFSATLNVQIKFFNMSVASDTGLYISLDGIDFSSDISVSMDSILNDLTPVYPNHVNRWPISGLWPVSSNGIRNSDSNRFDVFAGSVVKQRKANPPRNVLYTIRETETRATPSSLYLAFDFFLKNVSHSPFPDNLYFEFDSYMTVDKNADEEAKKSVQDVINSLRFGIVFMDTIDLKSDVNTIQNINCNNKCQSVIWEPNSTVHTKESIEKAKKYGINLVNGTNIPTYAVKQQGGPLDHTSGHAGIPLDNYHFTRQVTVTDISNPIFKINEGITKCRGYLWIEGQDIDSLEAENIKNAMLEILVSLSKDLAGYE